MIRRLLALTYYLYALRLAALSHLYFNRLYLIEKKLKSSLHFRKHISKVQAAFCLLIASIFLRYGHG